MTELDKRICKMLKAKQDGVINRKVHAKNQDTYEYYLGQEHAFKRLEESIRSYGLEKLLSLYDEQEV